MWKNIWLEEDTLKLTHEGTEEPTLAHFSLIPLVSIQNWWGGPGKAAGSPWFRTALSDRIFCNDGHVQYLHCAGRHFMGLLHFCTFFKEGTDYLFLDNFQRHLYSQQSWKAEIMSSCRAKKTAYFLPIIKDSGSLNWGFLSCIGAHCMHKDHLALLMLPCENWSSGNWSKQMLILWPVILL